MLPRRFRVHSRARETPDTVTLALEPLDGPLPEFSPGQFNMIWAFGIGEVPISISGSQRGSILHTVRSVGAVTRALCDARPGTMLGLRGPHGTPWGIEDAEGADIVVVAGGIGLAPLRPLIHAVRARRQHFGRLVVLVGARSPDLILFRKELQEWRSSFDVYVDVTVDVAGGGWRGHVGVVTDLVSRAHFEPSNTVAFICGPEVMMRFASLALIDRGVAPESIRVSMERNMKCGIGQCGHCQFGAEFVCRDGPVLPYPRVAPLLEIREV